MKAKNKTPSNCAGRCSKISVFVATVPKLFQNRFYGIFILLLKVRKTTVSLMKTVVFSGCGGRTRTYDLRVMSPTSFQLLYSAIFNAHPWILRYYSMAPLFCQPPVTGNIYNPSGCHQHGLLFFFLINTPWCSYFLHQGVFINYSLYGSNPYIPSRSFTRIFKHYCSWGSFFFDFLRL